PASQGPAATSLAIVIAAEVGPVVTVSSSVFGFGSGTGSGSGPSTTAEFVSVTDSRPSGPVRAREATSLASPTSNVSAASRSSHVRTRSSVPLRAGSSLAGAVVPLGTATLAEPETYERPTGSASSIVIAPFVTLGPWFVATSVYS